MNKQYTLRPLVTAVPAPNTPSCWLASWAASTWWWQHLWQGMAAPKIGLNLFATQARQASSAQRWEGKWRLAAFSCHRVEASGWSPGCWYAWPYMWLSVGLWFCTCWMINRDIVKENASRILTMSYQCYALCLRVELYVSLSPYHFLLNTTTRTQRTKHQNKQLP